MFTITVHLDIPQLESIGGLIVAAIDELRQAVEEQGQAIADEIQQFLDQLVSNPGNEEAVREVVAQIREKTEQIRTIVPDAEMPPAKQGRARSQATRKKQHD